MTGTLASSVKKKALQIRLYSPNKPMKTVGPTVPPGVVTLIRAASLCKVNVGETMANMEVMKDIAIVSHERRLAYVDVIVIFQI